MTDTVRLVVASVQMQLSMQYHAFPGKVYFAGMSSFANICCVHARSTWLMQCFRMALSAYAPTVDLAYLYTGHSPYSTWTVPACIKENGVCMCTCMLKETLSLLLPGRNFCEFSFILQHASTRAKLHMLPLNFTSVTIPGGCHLRSTSKGQQNQNCNSCLLVIIPQPDLHLLWRTVLAKTHSFPKGWTNVLASVQMHSNTKIHWTI